MMTVAQMTRAAAQSYRRASMLDRIHPAEIVPERPAIHAARRVSVGLNREGMEDTGFRVSGGGKGWRIRDSG